ncbi:MAG TPA: OB-fold nucleic acid binding domain-containing protein [Actinomycetales bacterium]|nr:OB-fold nucleic acid binding domain-containing protein [Actinomycetales bacterium]
MTTTRTGVPGPSSSTPDATDRSHGGRLRSVLRRLTSSDAELEAEDLRSECSRLGGTSVRDLPDRAPAVVIGTVRATTLRPRAGAPALVAEVYDGTGTLTVVWLGRRSIAGIEAGRRIRVHGRVARRDGRPVVFNPRYELLPGAGE